MAERIAAAHAVQAANAASSLGSANHAFLRRLATSVGNATNTTLLLQPPAPQALTNNGTAAANATSAIVTTIAAAVSSTLAPPPPPAFAPPLWTSTAAPTISTIQFAVTAAVAPRPTVAPNPGCQLLNSAFGWWLQAFLFAVCFISLIGKRFTDRVRRPWKVWFYDTSKQGFGSLLVHFGNILLSMAFGEWLDADADPCNWYWAMLTLDDTIGVGVQFVLLRLLQCFYRSKCVDKPELALCGEYGEPPNFNLYVRQLLDWQGIIVIQKVILAVLVVNYSGFIAAVAEAILGVFDPYPKLKLVMVMVITPLVMNVFALWMADNFLQGAKEKTRLGTEEPAVEKTNMSRFLSSKGNTVVGQRSGSQRGNNTEPRGDDGSGDESNRVLGFQEWKKRAAGFARLDGDGPPPTCISGGTASPTKPSSKV